jgi:aryl-alcohol dehydrogenase-like predicted oxidoreductase
MQTRRLGADGPEVTVVGLGCNNLGWRIGLEETRAVVDAAIAEGLTLFDTADVYGVTESETFLGEALAGRRDSVLLLTKFGNPLPDSPDVPRGSAAYVPWAADGSLRRLRTDVIDVYMYHRPDGVTPMAETVGAMAELVRAGKARYLGISNVDVGQIEEAAAAAKAEGVPLVCVENRVSLVTPVQPSAEVIPTCERLGLGLIPFYALESGLLTGKYARGEAPPEDSRFVGGSAIWPADRWLKDETFDKIESLQAFAGARGLSLLEVAVGGLAAMPAIGCVILGATKPEQVAANVRAGAWTPSADDVAELLALQG